MVKPSSLNRGDRASRGRGTKFPHRGDISPHDGGAGGLEGVTTIITALEVYEGGGLLKRDQIFCEIMTKEYGI